MRLLHFSSSFLKRRRQFQSSGSLWIAHAKRSGILKQISNQQIDDRCMQAPPQEATACYDHGQRPSNVISGAFIGIAVFPGICNSEGR